jgi:2-dehydro-3-deoxyphosphogluconate aldolase/(4S)-4-hydroxy-2-oxoglutarate aldolase
MIPKHKVIASLRESGLVAVIRTDNPTDLVAVCRALSKGGVKFVEITMTVPNALKIVHDAAQQLIDTDVIIGVGTILDGKTAKAAISSGAQFVVSPGFNAEVVKICNDYGVVVMPGAFTATEVINAWKSGGDVIKIFPGDIGGPAYIKALKEPLPQVELLPTKGVDFETAPAFIKAGAIAVGTGKALVSKELLINKDYNRITENAVKFRKIIREARGGKWHEANSDR